MGSNWISPVGLGRIATGVLGIVILGVGLHSHFDSAWTKDFFGIKLYEICEWPQDDFCPNIAMEYYFVAMIVLSFLLSVIGMVSAHMVDFSKRPYKLVDLGFHVIAPFILLSAATVYIVSAEQINKMFDHVKFRRVEKLAAAALTILQSLVYGGVAVLIAKQD